MVPASRGAEADHGRVSISSFFSVVAAVYLLKHIGGFCLVSAVSAWLRLSTCQVSLYTDKTDWMFHRYRYEQGTYRFFDYESTW